MAMKQVIFVSFFAAAVFGSPVTKDLINDVFQAGRAVTFFDIEVTELSSRIDLFQSEVNLQLVSYANYIRTLLQNLQVKCKIIDPFHFLNFLLRNSVP